ncbi:hypothetical protein CLV84_1341 [Neolewinella xylanilytica]|uniref:Uncharacterized protein n=1 Tax=Neolewinella xylanilytica TaxID=1514080 RepID=A0A2S6IA46_9BACT|nr:hypothetical protein [Neolewinella xylanilytica]PPK88374.1 hypothetical protein CLV84_1341 [Neolewinella xylanilytica]
MHPKQRYLVPFFSGSFYIGIALILLALGALGYEWTSNGVWYRESLIGTLGMGLLFLFFSGRPMVDERTRFLKFQALAYAFVITTVVGSLVNYLITYPDGMHQEAFSSYFFVFGCLLLAFICYRILSVRG